jgi:DNA polymerase-3 subunit delta
MERVLNNIKETFIPESARDFNLQAFYGDDLDFNPGEVLDKARSFPFMSQNRLLIVRRADNIAAPLLERFIPYLDEPLETTCLIFLAARPDFRKKFYKTIKKNGCLVNFKKLFDNQVVPWLMKVSREMALNIDAQACNYLQQIVGNRMRDLYSELEKIHIRYGREKVGLEEVKRVAIYSRSYTIFELMDNVSLKQCTQAMSVLKRYMEEEGKEAALRIIGMLIRQIKLLWQTKEVLKKGGGAGVSKELKIHPFAAKKLEQQSKAWSEDELERAFDFLYKADGLLKTGADKPLVIENAVLSICGVKIRKAKGVRRAV